MTDLMQCVSNLLPDTIGAARVASTLAHFAWQGVAIALLAWALMALARRPTVRYAIGCTGLVVMAGAPLVTYSSLAPPTLDAMVALAIDRPLSVVGAATVLPTPQREPLATPVQVRSLHERIEDAITRASPWIVMTWLLGVALMLVRHAVGIATIARLRRRARHAVPADLRARLVRVARRMRMYREVSLLGSTAIEAPCVVGWIRPAVLWPACAMTGLSPLQLDALLAHELAHVRRHDYLVNLLQACIEAVGFYHPAVWWLSRRVRQEREHCCDDIAAHVIGDRVRYAEALTAVESLRQGPILSVAAHGGSLMNRIRRLLAVPTPGYAPAIGGVGITVLVSVVLIAGVQLLRADRVTAPATQPAEVSAELRELARKDLATAQLLARRDRLMTPLRAEVQHSRPNLPSLTSVRDGMLEAIDQQMNARVAKIKGGTADAQDNSDLARKFRTLHDQRRAAEQLNDADAVHEIARLDREIADILSGHGTYYMGGHILRIGAYNISGQRITLLQAIVSAGEFEERVTRDADGEIWIDVIARDTTTPTATEWVARFAWSDIKDGRHNDFALMADDQIRVGVNPVPAITQAAGARDPATAAAAIATTQAAADYAISAGDLLQISVMDLTAVGVHSVFTKRVANSGSITLPYADGVKLAGFTEAQAEKELQRVFRQKQVLPEAMVSVLVVEGSDGKSIRPELLTPKQTSDASDEIQDLRRRLAEVEAKLEATAKLQEATANRDRASTERDAKLTQQNATLAERDALFARLLKARDELAKDLARLRRVHGVQSPLVIKLETQLTQAEKQIGLIADQLGKNGVTVPPHPMPPATAPTTMPATQQ